MYHETQEQWSGLTFGYSNQAVDLVSQAAHFCCSTGEILGESQVDIIRTKRGKITPNLQLATVSSFLFSHYKTHSCILYKLLKYYMLVSENSTGRICNICQTERLSSSNIF